MTKGIWIVTHNGQYVECFTDDRNRVIASVRLSYNRTRQPLLIKVSDDFLRWSNGLEAKYILPCDQVNHL